MQPSPLCNSIRLTHVVLNNRAASSLITEATNCQIPNLNKHSVSQEAGGLQLSSVMLFHRTAEVQRKVHFPDPLCRNSNSSYSAIRRSMNLFDLKLTSSHSQ